MSRILPRFDWQVLRLAQAMGATGQALLHPEQRDVLDARMGDVLGFLVLVAHTAQVDLHALDPGVPAESPLHAWHRLTCAVGDVSCSYLEMTYQAPRSPRRPHDASVDVQHAVERAIQALDVLAQTLHSDLGGAFAQHWGSMPNPCDMTVKNVPKPARLVHDPSTPCSFWDGLAELP